MKTKKQKKDQIEGGIKLLEAARTLIFADFTSTSANDLNAFRKSLYSVEANFEVFKKRLLRVIFEKKGITINPEDFEGQIGVAFSRATIDEFAGTVYSFSKSRKTFRIQGGFDVLEATFFKGDEVQAIGMLPSRDILLSQVIGTIAAPMSALLYVLNERTKQIA